MKQTNKITRAMTAAQDRLQGVPSNRFTHEPTSAQESSFINANHTQAVVYRLYTEWFDNLPDLINRYFSGFSIFHPFGYYENKREQGAVIEVIGTTLDLQSIVHLAGDIRQVNAQLSVLVTWNNISLLNVTADV